MNRFTTYLLIPLAAFVVSACSDTEDITPSMADVNYYAPPTTDNSVVAQLQRSFYNEVGSYLLFSDTLPGSNANHNEVLNMNYNFITGSPSRYRFTYTYISSDNEKQQATALLREQLVKRLGKAVPYSFLLVNEISWWDKKDDGSWALIKHSNSNKTDPHPTLVINDRCYAISMNNGEALETDGYFDDIFNSIVSDIVGRLNDEELAPFYAFSKEYYDKEQVGYEGLTDDYWNQDPDENIWPYGFLTDAGYDVFPRQDTDLKAFTKLLTGSTRKEVEEKYGSAPIIIQKYNTLRSILESKGINFGE